MNQLFFCQNFSEEHNDFLKPDNLRQDIKNLQGICNIFRIYFLNK